MQHLVGSPDTPVAARPLVPYSAEAVGFLEALSALVLADAEAREYPDVIAFGFWSRKANLAHLREEFRETRTRLGVGTVFHIAPSNVPINFMFSFAFGLLAGNSNVVRVPTRDFAQVRIMARLVTRLFADQRFARIASMTRFVRYEKNDEVTQRFTDQCNARVIWGGDAAINSIRDIKLPERATEVVFADRYSFSVIDARSVVGADAKQFERLVSGFYNDAFVMDQNACSSPHMVVWLGTDADATPAQARFWDGLHKHVEAQYELQPVAAMDKFSQACRNAVEYGDDIAVKRHGNFVYRVEFNALPDGVDALRGKFGFFYEYVTASLDVLAPVVNNRYQTLTYFGADKNVLRDFVVTHGLSGIDRIVPVGSALDMSVIWDGVDVVRSLSRIVDLA
ncbi:MAG TPA: acyl-CoA reductase [Gemmatimonadaceae bacterium]